MFCCKVFKLKEKFIITRIYNLIQTNYLFINLLIKSFFLNQNLF